MYINAMYCTLMQCTVHVLCRRTLEAALEEFKGLMEKHKRFAHALREREQQQTAARGKQEEKRLLEVR